MNKKLLFVLSFVFLIVLSMSSQTKLYWSDSGLGKILKSDLDGGNTVSVINENQPVFLMVDTINSKVYWTDEGTSSVFKSNFDGTELIEFITGLTAPKGICFSEENDIYLIDDDKIVKYNVSGDFVKVIHKDLEKPKDLVIYNSKMYWGSRGEGWGGGNIESSNLDGSSRKVLVSDVFGIQDIDIDKISKKIYWVQHTGGIPGSGIFRANLDGTANEVYIEKFIVSVSVDSESGYVYWSKWGTFPTIYRTNVNDVTDSKEFIKYFSGYNDIYSNKLAIDKKDNKIFFLTFRGNLLFSANLEDGKSVKRILKKQVFNPTKFEIDTTNDKIYWFNAGTSSSQDNFASIMKSDIDGSNKELVLKYPDVKSPRDFALDIKNNSLLFSDQGDYSIKKVDLETGQTTKIINNLEYPGTLVIDYKESKLYFYNSRDKSIQKSDLDGTNIENFITDNVNYCKGMAISNIQSKIYWTNGSKGTIYRSDLDGSNQERIVQTDDTTFHQPGPIFIDEFDKKLYFAITHSGEKLQRCNFDGSELEDLKADVDSPVDLVILFDRNNSSKEIANEVEVSVYPNPFRSIINIKCDYSISSVSLVDNVGRTVYFDDFINKRDFEIQNANNLVNGFYYLNLVLNNGTIKNIKLLKF